MSSRDFNDTTALDHPLQVLVVGSLLEALELSHGMKGLWGEVTLPVGHSPPPQGPLYTALGTVSTQQTFAAWVN